MGDFEKVFEDLDVQVDGLTGVMDSATGSAQDNQAVDQLLQQMMAEQGMDVGMGIAGANRQGIFVPGQQQ